MTLDEQSAAGNVRWALIWPEGMPESAEPWAQAAAEKAARMERKVVLAALATQIEALRQYGTSEAAAERAVFTKVLAVVARLGEDTP